MAQNEVALDTNDQLLGHFDDSESVAAHVLVVGGVANAGNQMGLLEVVVGDSELVVCVQLGVQSGAPVEKGLLRAPLVRDVGGDRTGLGVRPLGGASLGVFVEHYCLAH